MAEAQSILEILVRLKDEATQQMSRMSDEMKGLDMGFKNVGWSAGVFAGALGAIAGATILNAINAFGESEVQMARFDAMIRSLPPGLQQYRDELLKTADGALNFGFDNETAAVSLARLLQSTGDMDFTMKAFGAAMDLARFKGIGLEDAAQALILAFQGNSRLLKQLGIDVDDHASKETVLASVLQKVQGQAQAYADTQKGATDVLKGYLGELMEAIGKNLGFRETIINVRDMVVGWIRDQGGLNTIMEKYQALIIAIASLLIGVFVTGIIVAVAALLTMMGPFGLILAVGGALAAWIVTFALAWNLYWQDIKNAFAAVADWIVNKFNWLRDKLTEIADWIGNKIRGMVDALQSIANKVASAGSGAVKSVGNAVGSIWPFQHGGIVTQPTLGLVAESGPEAVIPLDRLGTGGGEINIYLQGDFYTTEEIAEKFGNQIAKLIKYQLRI